MVRKKAGWRVGIGFLAALASLVALGGCARSTGPLHVRGAYLEVHDPSAIIRDRGEYYLFSTGRDIPIRVSADLVTWSEAGSVFSWMPLWAAEDIPSADGIWAPDISFYAGRFHLYYAVSTFGSNTSEIGLATNATLDPRSPSYDWVDEGSVLRSGPADDWNAIDPNLVIDASGQPWLAFGSYWSGVKLVKLDRSTGKPEAGPLKLYSLARRPEAPDAIEAPFIVLRGGSYYLFDSYDFCCRGADSTYNVRVGRSSAVTGPYLDRRGRPMMDGGGTTIAKSEGRWRGPGGESVFRDASGAWWMVYHVYDAKLAGTPTLRISPLVWDRDGWPEPVKIE